MGIYQSKVNASDLALGRIYRPPNLSVQSIHDLCITIEDKIIASKYVIACGDFNIDLSDDGKPLGEVLADFIISNSLIQPIHEPTHITDLEHSSSTFDLILTSPKVPGSYSGVLNVAITDHVPILLEVSWKAPKLPANTIHCRSFNIFY